MQAGHLHRKPKHNVEHPPSPPETMLPPPPPPETMLSPRAEKSRAKAITIGMACHELSTYPSTLFLGGMGGRNIGSERGVKGQHCSRGDYERPNLQTPTNLQINTEKHENKWP